MNKSEQVRAIVEDLPTASPGDENAPVMPFPTSLTLDKETEQKLVDHILERTRQIEGELGKTNIINSEDGGTGSARTPADAENLTGGQQKFFSKRKRFTSRYYNDVQDREVPGTIFNESNLTASLSQRITLQMYAKAKNVFFGSNEWFEAYPVGDADAEQAQRLARYTQFKAKKAKSAIAIKRGIEFALVRGESVVKLTHRVENRIFKRRGVVMILPDGNPMLDGEGNPVFKSDQWVPEMAPEAEGAVPINPEEAPAAPVERPTGREYLKRDPNTFKPEAFAWEEKLVEMRRRMFAGPDIATVHFEDFLCPLGATSVDKADFVAHTYDVPVMRIVELFKQSELLNEAQSKDIHSQKSSVGTVNELLNVEQDYKSADKAGRAELNEQAPEAGNENPQSQWVEAYLSYDIDGDGVVEEIMAIVDRTTKLPVYYDYLDNMVADGRRPFRVIRGREVDGRWYGYGSMEYFENEQEFIDLLLNRRNFGMSASGRITFWNPHATVEGHADPTLLLKNGGTYKLREGFSPKDACEHITLPDDQTDTVEFLSFWTQLMQLKSGVIHAGDQNFSGLASTKLATGIRNIEEAGDELFSVWQDDIEEGVADTLLGLVHLMLSKIDRKEVFEFFDNENDKRAFESIEPDQVRDLDINVSLRLTKSRRAQVLQAGQVADGLISSYYARPLPVQEVTKTLYRQILGSLQLRDAENAITPTSPEEMGLQPTSGGTAGPMPAEGGQQTTDSI